jgi:hypothetical protein
LELKNVESVSDIRKMGEEARSPVNSKPLFFTVITPSLSSENR